MIIKSKKYTRFMFIILTFFLGAFLVLGLLFLNFSPQFGARSSDDSLVQIKKSPNYKNGIFQNIEKTVVMKDFKIKTLLDYLSRGNTIPNWVLPIEKLDENYFNQLADSRTKIIWFGHSAVLVEIDNKKIMIDPMLSNVPSPLPMFGSKRFNSELPLSAEELPELDMVLISHDHYDHLDYDSIIKIKDKVKMFYVPFGVKAHLLSWGVEEAKIVELDWWGQASNSGITFTLTPARHFSGRGLFDRNRTLWGSWVIKGTNSNIFFSGDSGYHEEFKKIGETYGPFDLVMLDSGQYNEQWADIHMTPEESVQASVDLKSSLLLPIHWGAFKLSIHDWDDPIKRVVKRAAEVGMRVVTPKIGEVVILGEQEPVAKWWER